ncbi:MAG: CDP-glycerol glycerophosphotransferase family protein [Quinella sp. 1Q7]|nr:CDP-glycerol glycerophosphotransferase family protein [Quinella sp. 1Q7]
MIQSDSLPAEELLAEKIDVVLIVLNRDALEDVIKILNLDRVNLVSIVMERAPEEPVPLFSEPMFYQLGETQIPINTFADVRLPMRDFKTAVWLICGGATGTDDALQMKNLLTAGGIRGDNIFNVEVTPKISDTWSENLRHICDNGADFFVTGNEYAQVDVNFNWLPTVGRGGVNLADANQTLRQGYRIAKHVFENVAPDTIKFVLIGIEPRSFKQNTDTNFLSDTRNLQYAVTFGDPTDRDEFLLSLLNDDFKKIFSPDTDDADINFDDVKFMFNRTFSAATIDAWDDDEQNFSPENFDDSLQLLNDYIDLKDYIELCLANGAKPVGVIFPFAPVVRKNFNKKFLSAFRKMIRRLEENYDFICANMFNLKINYDCFCDMTHLNARGQSIANEMLALKLYAAELIPAENFCGMGYDYFYTLSAVAPKDEYNALIDAVLEASAAKIRRKDKIKLAFVLHEQTQWFGAALYNLFARDERFETTFFICARITGATKNKLFERDFWRSVEQFNTCVSCVFVPEGRNTYIPPQDVLIYLTPFPSTLPFALRAENFSAECLIAHIPFAFDISIRSKEYYNRRMFRVAWKVFFSSVCGLEMYAKKNSVGMPRGVFSGYPKMDVFFNRNAQFMFDWKMTRPDAKKIIWAPHWSISSDVKYSTFQWNFEFMYEFAKTHPETSWVVKPHPGLFAAAVEENVFESVADFEKYLRAWNDLPNAQVVVGAYYEDIFATSDGMIHDSDTFIAEYQYVDKPMIFLTRDTQRFNELGKKILRASYLVDGQDFDAIAETIQRVFIDGDDYKAVERKEVFDKYLNYPKACGMLASEFIYGNIADGLKEVSE